MANGEWCGGFRPCAERFDGIVDNCEVPLMKNQWFAALLLLATYRDKVNIPMDSPHAIAQEAPCLPEMFLAADQWSPRFQGTFFTVKMETFDFCRDHPPESSTESSDIPAGKGTFPAYYYKIDVCSGHAKHSVLRRYSQFDWLVSKVSLRTNVAEMPPKSWICQSQDKAFAKNRLEQLREFLEGFLSQPGIAKDPRVVAFLELERFAK
jgi:PX domain